MMSEMVGGLTDVRIIAGTAKGIRLKTPKGMNTRPTADRVKESVFGILAADVVDAEVLDLFSGTGNLGLEALSRGAVSATMVDKNIQSVKIMMENAILTDLSRAAVICREEVTAALKRLQASGKSFDLIFCDPPYNLGLAPKVLACLDGSDVLREGGIFVLEHSRHEKLPEGLKRIVAYRSEFYGETVVSFFMKQEGNNSENCSVPG
jgi:16S rRNA (guanine(966)-N(2))-methyltransferase RsmD